MRAGRRTALVVLAAVAGVVATMCTPAAAHGGGRTDADTIDHGRDIQRETTARYGRQGLVVTEASATAVIESFTLLTASPGGARVIPADNGIYFALCARQASCPYPAPRFARPASDFLPRRAALELAIRAFAETSANVVAVSLPTRRFTLFIVERDELWSAIDARAIGAAVGTDPVSPPDPALRALVDRLTRSRIFVPIGLEPTDAGGDTLTAAALWSDVGHAAPSFARDEVGNDRGLFRADHFSEGNA